MPESRKKNAWLERRTADKGNISPGIFVKQLFELYRHDGQSIYNIDASENILETLFNMKECIPEKQWEKIIRNSVKQTKIEAQGREEAVKKILQLLD